MLLAEKLSLSLLLSYSLPPSLSLPIHSLTPSLSLSYYLIYSLPLCVSHTLSLSPPSLHKVPDVFLKVIHKLHKEYISGPSTDSQAFSELLQISLDLMKGRVAGMNQEARKGFFTILTSLIEKAPVHQTHTH